MTLALQSLRLMLICSAVFTALMLVLWLGLGNSDAKGALPAHGFNLVASLFFTATLSKGKSWVAAAFAAFCIILFIGSKMGGFTLITFPAYVMAILSFGGFAGIMQWFSDKKKATQE